MDNRELFARLIKCEAGGEGVDGMKAVATVIMDRGEYQRVNQGDLRMVIEQQCQFSCLKTMIGGEENVQNIWVVTPDPIHYEVADWAISGNIFLGAGGDALWYMNPFNPQCPPYFPYNRTGYWYTRIHQHCFFNPTEAYGQT